MVKHQPQLYEISDQILIQDLPLLLRVPYVLQYQQELVQLVVPGDQTGFLGLGVDHDLRFGLRPGGLPFLLLKLAHQLFGHQVGPFEPFLYIRDELPYLCEGDVFSELVAVDLVLEILVDGSGVVSGRG